MEYKSYWHETAAPFASGAAGPVAGHYDVAVIGAGFTGLGAARRLALEGRSTVVLEAGTVGCGASGRNGGHLNNGIAHSFLHASETFGVEKARAMYQAFDAGVDTIERIIAEEGIDCAFRRSGKLKLASLLGKAVVFDFAQTRGGEHARVFLDDWRGTLVCDDYGGYKALFRAGVTEAGCMAHARRKFHELWANHKSQIAEDALKLFGVLYDIERQAQELTADQRRLLRQQQGRPAADTLQAWLLAQRQRVPHGSATAKAIDYSLKRWPALIRYATDGRLPIDNNPLENNIRPIAIGKKNWLFVGSERAGKRAAAIQTLLATAKLNGLDPAAWLRESAHGENESFCACDPLTVMLTTDGVTEVLTSSDGTGWLMWDPRQGVTRGGYDDL